jgi:uncharacterized Zn-finger protein
MDAFNCEKCKSSFSTKKRYEIHLKTYKHINGITRNQTIKKYFEPKCDICGEEFSRPDSIKRHKFYKHPTEEDLENAFKCELCGFMANIQSLYQTHIKSKRHIDKLLKSLSSQQITNETPDNENSDNENSESKQ